MQRYFFHTANGHIHRDRVGVTLADATSAQTVAVRLAGELLQHRTAEFLRHGLLEVRVSDGEQVLYRIIVASPQTMPFAP